MQEFQKEATKHVVKFMNLLKNKTFFEVRYNAAFNIPHG